MFKTNHIVIIALLIFVFSFIALKWMFKDSDSESPYWFIDNLEYAERIETPLQKLIKEDKPVPIYFEDFENPDRIKIVRKPGSQLIINVSEDANRVGKNGLSVSGYSKVGVCEVTRISVSDRFQYRVTWNFKTALAGSGGHVIFVVGQSTFSYFLQSEIKTRIADFNDDVKMFCTRSLRRGFKNDWGKISFSFEPRRGTKQLVLFLGYGQKARGKVNIFFDDLKIERIPLYESFIEFVPKGFHSTPSTFYIKKSIPINGERRKAIFAPPNSNFDFKVKVPQKASLEFGLGFLREGRPSRISKSINCRVLLTRDSGEQLELFSKFFDLRDKRIFERWFDYKLDLSAFGGEKDKISFEVTHHTSLPRHGSSKASVFAAISNPVLYSSRGNLKDVNVLLITLEGVRPDHLGCYGYDRDTSPTIDNLAKSGVMFSNYMILTANTAHSMSMMMTSRYIRGSAMKWVMNNYRSKTMAEILEERGYFPVHFSFDIEAYPKKMCTKGFRMGSNPLQKFDWPDSDCDPDLGQVLKVLDWLDNNKDKKFFVWLHYKNTHVGAKTPRPYDKLFDNDYEGEYENFDWQDALRIFHGKIDLSKRDLHRIIALYDGKIRKTDDLIELVVDKLESLGLMSRTLIIISADHGEDLYVRPNYWVDHNSLYDTSIRAPLIFHYPRGIPQGGKKIEDMVEVVDIAPTILDILDIPLVDDFEGVSLLPLIRGKSFPKKDCIYLEFDSAYAIRTEKWKYILNERPRDYSMSVVNYRREELYDLEKDPWEKFNVVNKRKKVAKKLKDQLVMWRKELEKGKAERGIGAKDREEFGGVVDLLDLVGYFESFMVESRK